MSAENRPSHSCSPKNKNKLISMILYLAMAIYEQVSSIGLLRFIGPSSISIGTCKLRSQLFIPKILNLILSFDTHMTTTCENTGKTNAPCSQKHAQVLGIYHIFYASVGCWCVFDKQADTQIHITTMELGYLVSTPKSAKWKKNRTWVSSPMRYREYLFLLPTQDLNDFRFTSKVPTYNSYNTIGINYLF